jgi:hypothetical protein
MSKQKSQKSGSRQTKPSRFDSLSSGKKDGVCILILYVLILFLFGKIIFGNMVFSDSGDTVAHLAWTKAIEHINATEQDEPLWIPYIFSGMPIFATLSLPRDVNYLQRALSLIGRVLFFNSDLSWFPLFFFLLGVFMYILARQLEFSHLPSLIASLTMMLNPYAIGLAEAGHGSKLIALSYVPLVFLLTRRLFMKRDTLTFALLAAALGTMFLSRHPQIAFYGMLTVGCYVLYELLLDIRVQPSSILKKASLFVLAAAIGFSIYSYEFFPADEYARYSIRGGSETGVAKGLDYDYATNWSFHPVEMMGLVIPSFMGIVPHPGSQVEAVAYWGWMPFTNSLLYLGIIPLLLAIIAIIYRRNRMTWFLIAISTIFLFISFGRHFGLVYNLMFNYLPYFNKLRVPVMILHLLPIMIGILAAYGFSFLTDLVQNSRESEIHKLEKRLRSAIIVIGGLFILGLILNDTVFNFLSNFMFQKEGEVAQLRQQYGVQASQALAQIKKARFDLFWTDFVKFAIISCASLGVVIAFLKRKISPVMLGGVLVAILIIDLTLLDVKYIDPKPSTAIQERFVIDPAIEQIRAENDTSAFRVFPVGRFDEENLMMYHLIQSVEGYSPAKLKIYQDVRDSCFARGNRNVLNMLNVKYFVGEQQAQDGSAKTFVQLNPDFLPRAWFVDSVVVSGSKAETFSILNSPLWNPRTTAVLEKNLSQKITKPDSSSAILAAYRSREIKLRTYCSAPSLLVVSEIYYPAGWKAYVDGAETEILKTNYILRSVVVPAGTHELVFRFDPPAYQLGFTLSQSAWGVTALLALFGLAQQPWVRNKLGLKKKEGAV